MFAPIPNFLRHVLEPLPFGGARPRRSPPAGRLRLRRRRVALRRAGVVSVRSEPLRVDPSPPPPRRCSVALRRMAGAIMPGRPDGCRSRDRRGRAGHRWSPPVAGRPPPSPPRRAPPRRRRRRRTGAPAALTPPPTTSCFLPLEAVSRLTPLRGRRSARGCSRRAVCPPRGPRRPPTARPALRGGARRVAPQCGAPSGSYHERAAPLSTLFADRGSTRVVALRSVLAQSAGAASHTSAPSRSPASVRNRADGSGPRAASEVEQQLSGLSAVSPSAAETPDTGRLAAAAGVPLVVVSTPVRRPVARASSSRARAPRRRTDSVGGSWVVARAEVVRKLQCCFGTKTLRAVISSHQLNLVGQNNAKFARQFKFRNKELFSQTIYCK